MSEPMSSQPSDDSRNERFERILADYLRAKEAGEQVDPQLIIAAHPDLADDLRSFFQNHAAVNQLAAPLREALAPQDTPTLDPSAGENAAGIGTRLKYFGDYELLDEIARGGMGVVFKAKQLSLRRIVAVKMILAGQLAEEAAKQRFRSEAEAAAQLDHPNIVPIFEIGEHAQQCYFSMAYIEGQSLAEIVRGQPLPEERAARYLRAIALAIHYAHQQSVLHRDLKPSNVLIDAHDQPRVTDFGLAKCTNTTVGMTATGDVLGTPSYMPPEQAAGKSDEIGPASDVYSIGAMLYELVTGRPPFKAATALDTVLQVMTAEPAPPRVLNPALSKDLETIILKCLRKEPSARYASAQALADDLFALLEGRPIQARRPGVAEYAVRWLRKQSRSAVIALVASGAALLFAGGLVWGWQLYQQSQLGFIKLATTGPPLKAELLNEFHEQVIPSFTVPTEQPIQVTTGSYWLRLSSPQQASETLQIDVPAAKTISATVQLPPRQFRVKKESLPPLPEQLYLGPEPGAEEFQHDAILSEEVPDKEFLASNTAAGKFARLQPRLGFTPVGQPSWVELPQPCVVLLRRESNKSLTMLAIEVESAKIVWQQPLQAFWPMREYYGQSWEGPGCPWPLAEDLDGDGNLELVVPELDPVASECTLGLAVHDARDGKRKWGRKLHPTVLENFGQTTVLRWKFDDTDPQVSKPPLRFMAGRDLNGDGVRELYVATVQQRHEHNDSRLNLLNCLALSGSDGATIWHWQTPAEFSSVADANPLQYWRTAHDGWPELLVPFNSSESDQIHRSSFVLSSRDGRLQQILPGVTFPRVADLNGDGTPDVYNAVDKSWPPSENQPVSVLSGEPQFRWQRLGVGRPLADLDGDGTRELKLDGGEIVSGSSGRIAWQLAGKVKFLSAENLRQLDLDCDQDGNPDLLYLDRHSGKSSLIAFSGKTGNTLWRQPATTPDGSGEVFRLEFSESHDVTGDKQPELLVSFFAQRYVPGGGAHYRQYLEARDGTTGTQLWLRPQAGETANHTDGSEDPEAPRIASRDLNGDQKLDLVLWANLYRNGIPDDNARQPPNSLIALQGDTGKKLWEWKLPDEYVIHSEHDYGDNPSLPRPAVVDLNGDGCDDVVVMYVYYSQTDRDQRAADDHHYFEIHAFDGRTGTTLWKHREADIGGFLAPGYHHPSPRVARIDGQTRLIVRLPQKPDPERGGYRDYVLCVMNAQGEVIQPAAGLNQKQLHEYYEEHKYTHFWIADLNGDGSDEVLATYGGQLIAWEHGLDKKLWQVQLLPLSENEKLPKGAIDARLPFQIPPAANVVSEPPPVEQNQYTKWDFHCEVVPAHDEQSPKLTVTCSAGVFGLDPLTGNPQWHAPWTGERMHPLQAPNANGLPLVYSQTAGNVGLSFLPRVRLGSSFAPPPSSVFSGPTKSPRLPRSLPWAGEYIRWDSWVGGYFLFHGKSAYPTAVGLAFVVLAVWVWIIARQRQSRRGVWIATGLAAIGAILAAVQFDPYVIWLTLKYGLLFVLPVLAFLVILIHAGWKQNWRRLAISLGSALGISLVVGIVWLLIDAPTLAANERYVASQDWSLILIGMHLVGAALLGNLIWQTWRQTSRSARPAS